MRAAVIIAAVPLPACFPASGDPPEVAITSPLGGQTITHHDPIVLDVEVFGDAVADLKVMVDGAIQPGATVTPAPIGQACEPCSFRVMFPTFYVREGSHVVSVGVFEDATGGAPLAEDGIDMVFDDVPALHTISPAFDADLVGAGMVQVSAYVRERGSATATLVIDGVAQPAKTSSDCLSAAGCAFTWPWDTSEIAAGRHDFMLEVVDAHGNTSREERSVTIDDLVRITSIEVTGISESPSMEIEVYLYDDTTNELLGCAGSLHGLVSVDAPDVRYAVDARLIDVNGGALRGERLSGKTLRFEVWEDDDAPVCPTPIDPDRNNLVGVSPAMTYAQWKAQAVPMAFPGVTELAPRIDRPLVR